MRRVGDVCRSSAMASEIASLWPEDGGVKGMPSKEEKGGWTYAWRDVIVHCLFGRLEPGGNSSRMG